jgi:hypothetical protein
MAKQNINVGTTANDKKGDSLRAAFQKVNANFTELYTALGLNSDGTLNLGAFEFTGSTLSTTDSTAIVIDQATTVTSNLTVGGDIIPQTANGSDLGSLARPFRSLYVSNRTVFLGGVPLSLEPGTNELRVNNVPISQNITYADIPNAPVDVSDLTDDEGLLGGGGNANTGNFVFDGNSVSVEGDSKLEFNADGGTNVYLTSTTNDSTAVFINQTGVQAYGSETVNLQVGAGLVDLENTYLEREAMWVDIRDQDAQIGPTRPWAGMPSYEAYDLILSYNPGQGLPLPGNLAPTAYAAITAYYNWQNLLNDTGIGLTASDKTWSFTPDGKLTLPENGDIVDSTGASVLGGSGANLGDLVIENSNIGSDESQNFVNLDVDGAGWMRLGTFGNEKLQIIVDYSDDNHIWEFGTDGNLTVPGNIQSEGNINIDINLSDSTLRRWSFGEDGSLTLPGTLDYRIGESFGGGSLAITSEGTVSIFTNSIEGFKLWSFDTDGNLQLPVGGEIRFSYGYIDQDDDVQGNALRISGGNSVVIKTDEDGKTWEFDNRGVLRLPEGGDIINSSGQSVLGGGGSSLINGDWEVSLSNGGILRLDDTDAEQNHVKFIAVQNPDYNNDGISTYGILLDVDNQAGWTFLNDGTLQLPEGGDILDDSGQSVLGGARQSANKEIKLTVGNTDYFAIVNRANNNDDGVESSAVAYDSEGNIITLHISEVEIENGDNEDRLIISKFDSSATLLWQKQIQEDMDVDQSHDVVIDEDDNIIVLYSRDSGDDTVGAIKYSSSGSELWRKDYHPAVPVTINSSITLVNTTITAGTFQGAAVDVVTLDWNESSLGDFTGWSLQQSSNDGTTWTTISTVRGFGAYDANAETTPLYLPPNSGVTLSRASGYVYRVTRQGANSDLELAGAVTDGTYTFVAAYYDVNTADETNDIGYLMKIANSNGSLVWAKSFYIENSSWGLIPNGLEITSSGDVVVTGVWYVPGDPSIDYAFVTKFNGLTGAEVWTRIFNGIEGRANGGDVTADSQGNVFVSINAQSNIVHENSNTQTQTAVYVMKLNSSGVTQWTRRIGPGPCSSIGTGIDCDSLGNVYLSALTTAQKNPTRDQDNYYSSNLRNTKDVLVVAKYSTAGAVLWQRYIEADGYEFHQTRSVAGNDDAPGEFDYNESSGRNLSVSTTGKLAVQVTVRKRDLDDNVENERYYESITFQIDQDGREMTIGGGDDKFTVKASRVPGKFVTLVDAEEVYGSVTPVVADLTSSIEVTTPAITYADAELAQLVIKSAPYEYVFGNDGTLTIPNDGDVKLTQTQLGWFSIFGQVNDDNFDVWNRTNCVDTATGDVYVAGQEDGSNRGFVARYTSAGELLWSIRLYDNTDEYNTRCNAIKMNPVTGNVTVLVEYYGSPDAALIVEIDPDTAQIVNSLGFRDLGLDDGVTAYDFDFQTDGSVVVVGRKYDERKTYSVTPVAGTVDVLIINRSDIAGDAFDPDQWVIAGTGITGFSSIFGFNYYSGLTGTVRQGSGAVFDIANNGDGTYGASGIQNNGTNYLAGHKIKVLGTALGGATPANDCTITVTSISEGGAIFEWGVSGTAAGGAFNIYGSRTGTNYQTGSGLEFNFWGPTQGTDYANWDDHQITAGGTNYVDGDIVTISGALLGGISTANDLIAQVGVTEGSVTGFYTMSGTSQNTTYRIVLAESEVNFGAAGSWNLSYPLGGQAFVWSNRSAGWNKTVGSLNPGPFIDERYFSVAVGSDGSIYAAGQIYTDDSTNRYQAVVSKFNSSGVHQWSRALNPGEFGSEAKCVAVRGTTVAVSSYYSDNNETIITKLDTSGNIKWQRRTFSGDDSSVAIDTNGDIYAAAEANLENNYGSSIKVIRFASNGEPIWRKIVSTYGRGFDTDEYFKNGRNLTLDAEHFYVSGYTTAFDDDAERGFLVKLPKAGDCDGFYGAWTVQTDAYDVDKVNVTEANTFTPNIQNGNFENWEPDISSNWWDPSEQGLYQYLESVVDRDGGAIEFGDGTRQTSSAQQIPQRKISTEVDHRLCLDDMGKHIYVTTHRTTISVSVDERDPLPVGFTVVIVNYSEGGSILIRGGEYPYGGNMSLIVPGVNEAPDWLLDSPGMATLLKVDQNTWFMTGNVTVSD